MNVSNGVLVFAVLGALLTISNGASAQAPSAIALSRRARKLW